MENGPSVSLRTAPPNDSTASLGDLFKRWQLGRDERARDELVARYMPLTTRLARRYRGANEPFDDLKQAATIGLLKAIDRFDPSRPNGFQAYAVPTILGELKRYFRDNCWAVHMPRGIQDLAVKVDQAQRKLATASGRSPTYVELAEYLELTVEEVLDAVEASAAHYAVSLDVPHESPEGEASTLGESIGELDPGYELVDCGEAIRMAAVHLSERERKVLALRFLEDRTQTQIADEIGVSQMQVSRIIRKSLQLLSTQVDGPQRSVHADRL
jgi:RNA polymerase sigma-B factor